MLNAMFRGNLDTPHGWAAANTVFYNCKAPILFIMKPPTAQNFVLGVDGLVPQDDYFDGLVNMAENTFRGHLGTVYDYKGNPVMGDGWIHSRTAPIANPHSLYYKQLADRLQYGDLSLL